MENKTNTPACDSLVIIPTYKEEENIGKIIPYILTQLDKDFHILIIDDNSPDDTAKIVKSLMKEYPEQLFLEERKGKLGLGTAYIHGFKWALQHDYEFIFEMDADFSHPPKSLVDLYKACKQGADLSIGSRYLDGKISVVNWPMGRLLMSYCASIYVRKMLGFKVYDTTAGFVCYKRELLEQIKFDKIKFVGYAFQIEMKYTAWKLGFKIKEVPIIFTDRVLGESKMSMKIFKEAFFGIFSLRLRNWKKY
ncbi:MAG: polyprenol monophosphomannose synthase [Bacteroidota bacterium]|nr:polyprenol monophosphomannose synthase [Bacteroidota bacterium]